MHEAEFSQDDNEEKGYIEEIAGILNTMMHALREHPDLMNKYFPQGFTLPYFMNAVASHVVEDYPEDFDLTKTQGHTLRGWAQSDHVWKELRTGWQDDAGLLEKLKV